jgi:diaminopimelate epimerase
MMLEFTKMHGLGNDFVVIDATRHTLVLSAEQIRFIADRRRGVGCDQVLLVGPAQAADVDFDYRIFNADGGEVEQCGNGARCFARFVRAKGLTNKTTLRVQTRSGVIDLHVEEDEQVRVNMGVPDFEPAALPFDVAQRQDRYSIETSAGTVNAGAVSMGNPHVVIQVENVATAPVATLGPLLESHSLFPKRVNVGFMQVVDRDHIRLRVFERGVGETQACGTGACAAVAVGRQWGLLNDKVVVNLPGGSLTIAWADDAAPLFMTGPAVTVFEGQIEV